MAGKWRGWRLLVIGDRRFRWACAFAEPWAVCFYTTDERRQSPPDRVLVRPEDGPNRRLSVSWPLLEGPVVTPGVVRACIDEAMLRGWPDAAAQLEMAGTEVPFAGQRYAEFVLAADPPKAAGK